MPISPELKKEILEYIKQPIPQNDKMPIVKRSVPVPFFGNIETARVATISINPSNLEFEDAHGKVLKQDKKRFVDRDELGVQDVDYLTDSQAEKVYGSLSSYFKNKNLYTNWFDRLQKPLRDLLGGSYCEGTMANFDIYPWATKEKWSDLYKTEAKEALKTYRNSKLLKNMLLQKDFEYVYINGSTVKTELEEYFPEKINEHTIIIEGQRYCIYEGKLDNGTKLIGLNCYIPSTPIKTEVLKYLLKILADKLYITYKQPKNNSPIVSEKS